MSMLPGPINASRRLYRRARGAVSVLAVVFIATIGMAALVGIDIGNLFYTQRTLQRTADLAALAAAQRLDQFVAGGTASPNCPAPFTHAFASQAAVQNGFIADGVNAQFNVCPGVWDALAGTPPSYFTAQATVGASTNAARAVVTRNVPYFFSIGQRNLTATAIAKNTAIVSFSLGSGLAALNNGLLNQMLGSLLGNANPLNLDLVSYQGLANTNIRVADLMAALSVGTLQQLLSSQVSFNQFVTALVAAGSQNGLAGVTVGSAPGLNTLVVGPLLRNTLINIGNGPGAPGILQLLAQTGNDQSALNAQLNVLDLLTTAAQIANQKAGVTLSPSLTLPNVAGVSGLLNVALSAKIIQPPVIAIGPAGKDASGNWRTQATSAQVQLGIRVNASVLGLLNLSVPIGVSAVGANAYAVDTRCPVPRTTRSADIAGQISPTSMCIANGADSSAFNLSSCGASSPATLASVLNILGVSIPVLTIKANPSPTASVPFGSNIPYSGLQIGVGQTQRATATSGIFTALLTGTDLSLGVLNLLLLPVSVSAVSAALAGIGNALDSTLTPLLEALGIQLGYADIKLISLDCDAVELVY